MPRFNLEFSDDAAELLTNMATQQGVTKAEVVRRAINLEKWFQDTARGGGRILVERDGVVREIVKL